MYPPKVIGKDPPSVFGRPDKASRKFPDQLLRVIQSKEFDLVLAESSRHEVMEIADYLDEVPSLCKLRCYPLNPLQALDALDPTGVAFGQVLLRLQEICTPRMRFPLSQLLPVRLLNVNENHITSSRFSDTFRGTFCGLDVCVRRLTDASISPPWKVKKGCTDRATVDRLTFPNGFNRYFIERP